MTARVVGPNQGQLPPTSPLALFSNGGERERERERESLVYTIFFLHSTPQHEQPNDKVLGVIAIFSVFTYVLIVYVTSMNILHYL